jgi:hypothetical protein
MIQRFVELFAATLVVTVLAAPARADKRVALVVGNSAYENVIRLDDRASDTKLIAEPARTPRPRAAGEKCATLKGQTGTDFYCASSVLAPQFGNTYGVDNLFSNKPGEAWVEGKPGQGVGEWVTIDFNELRLVKAVIVRNGYQKNSDIFSKNNRVRRLRLVSSQGETQTLTLRDSMDLQTIALDPPFSAYWVQFIIDDIYPGSTYSDTAISKLFVTADPLR